MAGHSGARRADRASGCSLRGASPGAAGRTVRLPPFRTPCFLEAESFGHLSAFRTKPVGRAAFAGALESDQISFPEFIADPTDRQLGDACGFRNLLLAECNHHMGLVRMVMLIFFCEFQQGSKVQMLIFLMRLGYRRPSAVSPVGRSPSPESRCRNNGLLDKDVPPGYMRSK